MKRRRIDMHSRAWQTFKSIRRQLGYYKHPMLGILPRRKHDAALAREKAVSDARFVEGVRGLELWSEAEAARQQGRRRLLGSVWVRWLHY